MSRFVWFIVLVVSVLVVSVLACDQVVAQPVLSKTMPGAVQPGKSVELTLQGEKLDDPLQIWTSFPATVELMAGPEGQTDQTTRTCQVTLGADVAPGIGGMVVGSVAGVSEVLLLLIDDLNSVADNGGNHSLENAQQLSFPIAIDGISEGPQFDYYKVACTAGQRLSVEVFASRIAAEMDPVLRLLDSDGNEILMVDDDEGLGPDGRFSHLITADGEYLIEVRDNQYRKSGRYRMRVGDFPIVSVPYPLGGRLGSTARFEFAGAGADGALPVLMRIPDAVRSGELAVNARFSDGNSSTTVRMIVGNLPEEIEIEANNERELATSVTLPCAVNGRFAQEGDRDYFRFPATKDQRLLFRAVSRSLGSPSMVVLRVHDGEGKQVAETSVSEADEWTLEYTVPVEGMYFLEVFDLLHRGGPAHVYRVSIESGNGFSLAADTEKVSFATPVNTGAFALTVKCERRGFEGPIQLALDDPAPGYRLFNHKIPEKATEHRVIVGVPEHSQPGDLHVIRLIGSATVSGRPYTSLVHTSAVVRARRPQIVFPVGWMNGILRVSTTSAAEPFYAIPAAPVKFERQSGKVDVALTLERKNEEFKEGITLLTEGLPDGFTSEVKSEKESYTLTINGPQDVALGEHTIRLISYGEFNGTGALLVQDVPLEITDVVESTEVAEQ